MVAAAATPPRTLTPAVQTPVPTPVVNATPVVTSAAPVITPATPVVTPATPVTAPSVALALPGTVQQETTKTANVTYALMPQPVVPTGSDVQLASYYSLMQLGAIPVTPAPTHNAIPAQAGAPIAATSNGTVTETQAPDGTNAAPAPTPDNSVEDHKKKGD